MASALTKTELIAAVAERNGAEKQVVRLVIEKLAELVQEQITAGGSVTLPGIAKIACGDRPERQVRNPAKGEAMTKAADRLVKATPLKALSMAVQNPARRRRKTRPGSGGRRHGARAHHIAGACHGALALWAKPRRCDVRILVASFGPCCWRGDNSRRSSRGC